MKNTSSWVVATARGPQRSGRQSFQEGRSPREAAARQDGRVTVRPRFQRGVTYRRASDLRTRDAPKLLNHQHHHQLKQPPSDNEKAATKEKKNYNKIISKIYGNYGRILAEYPFLKAFRNNKLNKFIEIDGLENLNKIKREKRRAVFISGHFNNFELMALQIEKAGINLCAIYRPLNNVFLNNCLLYTSDAAD